MKETVGSLRAYFLIAGGLSGWNAVGDINTATQLGDAALPMRWMLVIWFPILASLLIGVGFVAAGIKLKAALPSGATWIKQLLLGSLLVLGIDVILINSVSGSELAQPHNIEIAIGFLITIYLMASVRRLSKEARAKLPPEAKVV